MTVEVAVGVLRRSPHQRRSHSLLPDTVASSLVLISIAPCGSIFTPATRSPAAITALTALVRSLCRKAEGRRGFISPPASDHLPKSRGCPTPSRESIPVALSRYREGAHEPH